MDRDEFEKRAWSTYNPVIRWNPQEILTALIENDGRKLSQWRVQMVKARKRLAERMAQFDNDPTDLNVAHEPAIMEVSDAEIASLGV